MSLELLRELFDYHGWAMRRAFDMGASLSADEWARVVTSDRSAQRILTHVTNSERMWPQYWRGAQPPPRLREDDASDAAALRATWEAAHRGTLAFVDALTEADLARGVEYAFPGGARYARSLQRLLLHLVHHAGYHRGELAAVVGGLGKPVLECDLTYYYIERWGNGV